VYQIFVVVNGVGRLIRLVDRDGDSDGVVSEFEGQT
jgi:hypothetical protein